MLMGRNKERRSNKTKILRTKVKLFKLKRNKNQSNKTVLERRISQKIKKIKSLSSQKFKIMYSRKNNQMMLNKKLFHTIQLPLPIQNLHLQNKPETE
jgi:hypothetical protein